MTLCRHSFIADVLLKKSNFKGALLAGTALVGIGLFPGLPRGATITYTNGQTDATNYTLTTSDTFTTAAGGSITATQSGTLALNGFAATLTALATTDSLTFSGVISGTGNITINGSGTLILSASNTYTGTTSIAGSGPVVLLSSGAFGTGVVSFDNDLALLEIRGSGIVIANDFNINSIGTISTTLGGTDSGTLSGNFALGTNTLFVHTQDAADTLTFSGNISGSGHLTHAGPGTLILSGTNTFSGGAQVNIGTMILQGGSALSDTGSLVITGNLQLDASETIGSLSGIGGTIDLGSNTLTVNQSTADEFNGIISGTGGLVKDGTATLTLSASNTYSGGTTIAAGSLQLDSSTGAGTGTITFNGSGTEVLALAHSLTVTNNFNLLSDATISTLAGGIEISTLSGNISGSGATTLTLDAVNIFDSLTLSGVISGSRSIIKGGSGSIFLTALNTYTGATTINAGKLFNNGGLTSNILVALGGTYSGTGTTTGTVTVNGTLAPGGSIGTMTVTGTVTLNVGSTLLIEVDSTGSTDLLNITGTLDILGGTLSVTPTDSAFGLQTTYTIASATGGITGAFDTITSSLNFLTPSYQIIGNDIILTLDLIGISQLAETPNQTAIAGQIDELLAGTPSQDLQDLVTGLLTDLNAVPANLDQLTGEGFAGLSTATLASTGMRVQAISNHLNEMRLCHNAQTIRNYRETCDVTGVTSSAPERTAEGGSQNATWGNGTVWFQGYGGQATMDAGGKFNVVALDIGYDRWITNNVLLGISGGFSRDQEKGFASVTSAEGKFIQVGVHTSITFDTFYFNGLVNYGFGDFTTRRNIIFGEIDRTALGSFDGDTLTGYGELGLDAQTGSLNIQPFLSLQYTDISRDGFTETGATSANLTVAAESLTSVQGAIGLRMSTVWDSGRNITVKPELRARFIYEFGNAADPRTSIVNLAGAHISSITNAAGYSNAFLVGLGFDISDGGDLHIIFDIDYLSSDEYDMWTGTGRVIWSF